MSAAPVPLVVFLHGPAGRPSDFDGVARRLPDRFPFISPDLWWGDAGTATVGELAGRLVEELRADPRDVVLVGSSTGARLALACACRLASRVRGVVLSGCPALSSDGRPEEVPGAPLPALLLWGTEDRTSPPAVGRRLRELLPGARLLFVLEAGHLPMVERPAVFAFHLSSFLNDLAPSVRPPRRLADEAA